MVNGAALGVTHLLVLTRTEKSVMLRIIRVPQGPTLTFRGMMAKVVLSLLIFSSFCLFLKLVSYDEVFLCRKHIMFL